MTRAVMLGAMLLLLGTTVRAEDAPAPSLALRTDPDRPTWSVAVSVDPLAGWLGVWGIRAEIAAGSAHVVTGWLAWVSGDERGQAELEAGYRLFPLGRGLEGPFVGPVVGARLLEPGTMRLLPWVGADLGGQVVWEGLLLGGRVGLEVSRGPRAQGWTLGTSVGVRGGLALGWAWM
ncbi:MAG: hypothetical protein NZ898_08875 [Myxococcota bacterium]|nr:hypothetical protein [Myxococcota bacterium]MDW8360904.1 hypothetical protein [Myxococcales bacterium]